MALGAFRLARHKVLVRRAAVIETLGAATILCVDKTGTLTENRMVLTTVWRGGEVEDCGAIGGASGACREPICGRPARLRRPPGRSHGQRPSASRECGSRETAGGSGRCAPIPLRPELLAFVQVWPDRAGGVLYAAKGRAGGDCPALPHGRRRTGRNPDAAVAGLAEPGLARAGRGIPREEDRDAGGLPENATSCSQGLIGFEDPVRAGRSAGRSPRRSGPGSPSR